MVPKTHKIPQTGTPVTFKAWCCTQIPLSAAQRTVWWFLSGSKIHAYSEIKKVLLNGEKE